MGKTKNFDPDIDKKLTCSCGQAGCDLRTVTQETLEKLQIMRDEIGIPMRINSGARCPLHECEKGRFDTDHQSCCAVDVAFVDKLHALRMIASAARLGATGIGMYESKKFVHLRFGRNGKIKAWWQV